MQAQSASNRVKRLTTSKTHCQGLQVVKPAVDNGDSWDRILLRQQRKFALIAWNLPLAKIMQGKYP